MKFRYKINDRAYVVVDDSDNRFTGQLFQNGCSHNMMSNVTETLDDMEQWIENLKEVLNGES